MLFDKDTDDSMIEKHFDYIASTEVEEPKVTSKSIQSHSRAWKINRIRNELRRIKNGRMSDSEKIDYLKNDLFWAVQDDKPTDKIVEAIAILQECKTNDESQETKRQNSISGCASGLLVYLFCVAIATSGVSYLSLPFCKHSQSKLCVTARVVPEVIQDYLHNPTSRVLPQSFNSK